ncbi:Imm1 family immunity protein [Amycolatopsis sp. WQ 127309]|uniref:Imm1 family immunity protein n=1 Tax=unclassified Amycolatopsis TaxID=2618356 RepID=UPI001FF31967|nr:Imm1 family immunity protein [Amycolatopsis sp. WQ 127309]UOZ08260.1 Imm1 family immunity protein [Amycolatopsis sp. WQ 127309]
MVTLEVWYNQEPDNDYADGDPAILVSSAAELDALIAQVQADTKDVPVPSMVECSVAGDPKQGVFDMGIGQDRGFVVFMTPEAVQTQGDGDPAEYVTYDYMAHVREIPAGCEVAMDEVRRVARHFLETGSVPAGLASAPSV